MNFYQPLSNPGSLVCGLIIFRGETVNGENIATTCFEVAYLALGRLTNTWFEDMFLQITKWPCKRVEEHFEAK